MLQDPTGHFFVVLDIPYKDTVHIKLGFGILSLDKKNPGISVDIGFVSRFRHNRAVAHFFSLVQILFSNER